MTEEPCTCAAIAAGFDPMPIPEGLHHPDCPRTNGHPELAFWGDDEQDVPALFTGGAPQTLQNGQPLELKIDEIARAIAEASTGAYRGGLLAPGFSSMPDARVYKSEHVPLTRTLDDGTVQDVLFHVIDGAVVVHPDRWDELMAAIEKASGGPAPKEWKFKTLKGITGL